MSWILLSIILIIFFNIGGTADRFLDLIAHVSRYRRYMGMYPACKKDNRGRVWKHTK